ncbi:galectin-4-like [Biomphalaria glabrata]|uniref:Galectin n=1 Tax=Biomphalaria glabrata TaxID=6526 RepID=A0A9W2ZZD9_BIOGL|nr:galectin-4-like [Biomphalaria glabrata]XP_055880290.1 galectin-4-like [Biomphalaria glabrata]
MESLSLEETESGVYEATYVDIPSSVQLPSLQPGTTIFIHGKTDKHAKDFSASFCVGLDTDYDVAFHYNPRLKDKIVYCNDKQRDDWGYEETEDYVPFKKDTVFELRFDVTQDGYEVSVDNTIVQFFKHRIPFQMVSHLYLTGDIRVNRVQLFDPESDEN